MYTSDPNQKERLEMMSGTSNEGKALYQSWVVDSCRHITHILEDMDTCKPPIDHILELLPRLQPRFYSIASSAKVNLTILRKRKMMLNPNVRFTPPVSTSAALLWSTRLAPGGETTAWPPPG